jgi:predicted alpha/beta-fold hydrolase
MGARIDTTACDAAPWLPGGHTQTLYGALFAPSNRLRFVRERIDTPDGDFLDLDWSAPGLVLSPRERQINRNNLPKHSAATRWIEPQDSEIVAAHGDAPALVLLHGLEGSSNSRYVQSILQYFRARGWLVVLAHFRGCSGAPNRLARSYFSGDIDEVEFIIQAVMARSPNAAWHVAGVSLGGNALLKYLGERAKSENTPDNLKAAVSICAPMDLVAAGNRLSQDRLCRWLYTRYFLRSMKPKVLEKAHRFPGAIDITRVSAAKTLKDFDDAYTAPMHGFHDALDYWQKASSKPWLPYISLPTLIINPRNDPFIPEASLPGSTEASQVVVLHQPAEGGHMGFVTGRFPGSLTWLPSRLARFFNSRL